MAQDTERKVQNWQEDPWRESGKVVSAIEGFSLRKRAELESVSRKMVSAAERGDLKGMAEGFGDHVLAMTGISDIARAAERLGLNRSWLPEDMGYGMRLVISLGVGSAPLLGDAYDLYTALTGYDPLYGEKLSTGERWLLLGLAIVPFLSGGAVRHGDEIGELAQYALRHGDEMPDLARGLLRGGDEAGETLEALADVARRGGGDAAASLGRRGDEAGEAVQAALHGGKGKAPRKAKGLVEAPQSVRRGAGDALPDDEWVDALSRHGDAGDLVGALGRKKTLYQGLTESRLRQFQREGLQIPSFEGYRGAGLYTTPSLEEAVGWGSRPGRSGNYVLRFEIEQNAWESMVGEEIKSCSKVPYRTIVEEKALRMRPELVSGFPNTQLEFEDLIRGVFPGVSEEFVAKVSPIEIDYFHGNVPLAWPGSKGEWGYEYVFKSRYAIQEVLNNPSMTQIYVATMDDLTQWRPISFPRR